MELSENQIIKVLSELNDDLENYFRNTIIAHLFFDNELVLRKFTPAAMTQFNLSPDDIGRSILELTNNLRYPSIVDNIKWVITKGEILEKEIQTTDLSWYQMNIIPYLKKVDNKQNGVIITFIDITNRVKDLKQQEKIISEYEILLDTISHDIKNRLSGMMLSIQFLNESDLEDKNDVKFLIEMLETGVNKMHKLVIELFDSRSQRHKYEAVEELLNIENILEDVRYALGNEITTSNAIITTQVDCSEIIFPRRHLRSILYNLVSNAIKFRSPDRNPEIAITSVQQDNYAVISVKDNGIGIDPYMHQEVFSKFYRIENSVEGSGVGLHLVKTLVTNAGGKVELESQVGVGTEFKIYLKSICSESTEMKSFV